MEAAQNSANAEEKSSAGDKYETSRAMSHLEKDMYARQLAEHLKELAALHSVNTDIIYTAVTMGTFIQSGKLAVFLGAGLGKQMINDTSILFLSQQAPFARHLMNKKQGDLFYFQEVEHTIDVLF